MLIFLGLLDWNGFLVIWDKGKHSKHFTLLYDDFGCLYVPLVCSSFLACVSFFFLFFFFSFAVSVILVCSVVEYVDVYYIAFNSMVEFSCHFYWEKVNVSQCSHWHMGIVFHLSYHSSQQNILTHSLGPFTLICSSSLDFSSVFPLSPFL